MLPTFRFLTFFVFIYCFDTVGFSQKQDEGSPKTVVVTPEALKIHKESFVFDGHNDLPWAIGVWRCAMGPTTIDTGPGTSKKEETTKQKSLIYHKG